MQPDLDDCCHSGCNPCVFDLYDEALERYRTALAEWQARQAQQSHIRQRGRASRVRTVEAARDFALRPPQPFTMPRHDRPSVRASRTPE
ncbi:oxidoreductase-like domain-containing protein [Paraburkholderia xenovorans]